MKLAPASAKRDWIEQTDKRFANRCLPMLIANQAGWVILNDRPLRAMWRGTMGLDGVIVETEGDPPFAALSHFGHGILTFTLPFLFRTQPGWACLFRGPANNPKDAIAALEGIVETDWSVATSTMNWKFTRRDNWVHFAAGEPICMIVPQQLDPFEAVSPAIFDIRSDHETYTAYKAWKDSRRAFIENLRRFDPQTVEQEWQRHYYKGTAPCDPNAAHPIKAPRHRSRLSLAEFSERDEVAEKGTEDGRSKSRLA